MKYCSLIIILCLTFQARSQYITEQKRDAEHIKQINLYADEVFIIHIFTQPNSDQLKITSYSEGEYAQNIGFHFTEEDKTLNIHSVFLPKWSSGYDKLSAHKVFAVRLEIEIPENKRVVIQSNLASVYGKGNYRFFEAELTSGRCELSHFTGKALINTLKGEINIITKEEYVKAFSHHGQVKVDSYFKKGEKISLKSIDGNIIIRHKE